MLHNGTAGECGPQPLSLSWAGLRCTPLAVAVKQVAPCPMLSTAATCRLTLLTHHLTVPTVHIRTLLIQTCRKLLHTASPHICQYCGCIAHLRHRQGRKWWWCPSRSPRLGQRLCRCLNRDRTRHDGERGRLTWAAGLPWGSYDSKAPVLPEAWPAKMVESGGRPGHWPWVLLRALRLPRLWWLLTGSGWLHWGSRSSEAQAFPWGWPAELEGAVGGPGSSRGSLLRLRCLYCSRSLLRLRSRRSWSLSLIRPRSWSPWSR